MQWDDLGKTLLLVALYIVTGKLGLLLAVPPGYATIIWPPSGIALGMLIVHGWRLWPGILLGSLLLNGYIAGAYSPEQGLIAVKATGAFGIAVGSCVQALVGYALIRRFVGLPLKLNKVRDVLKLFTIGGPATCLIAPSIGVGTLFLTGAMSASRVPGNWIAWWSGDVLGIVVFLPLVLLARGPTQRLAWRDRPVHGLPLMAMLMLMLPLGLTIYAWKIASESAHRQTQARFESLTVESEKALLHRLSSYGNATLGGAGLFHGSSSVTREEWRSYVQTIRVRENFPGMKGIGWIERVPHDGVANYLQTVRSDGAPNFEIHPASQADRYDIITYIEPEPDNQAALGLNIAFEQRRRNAADLSCDTGKPAITRHIVLIQDKEKTSGFLLLQPLYREGMAVDTVQLRRAALRGWVYAPFIARDSLAGLTRSQGDSLNVKIYDGSDESTQQLIYASNSASDQAKPAFSVRKRIEVMQQDWLVVWQSTPQFEAAERTDGPLFLLVGGLLFTGLFGLFLLLVSMRSAETMEWMTSERQFALPLLIFVLLAGGTYTLYATLQDKELAYARKLTHDEAYKMQLLVSSQIEDKLLSLQRMAQRWEMGSGTPFALWQHDAHNYIQQLSGLRVLEWVDPTYHVRWVEPLQDNENVIGLDVRFNAKRRQTLAGAAQNSTPTLSEPLQWVQGYDAFIAYLPLAVDGKFDGFLAAVFSIDEFFGRALSEDVSGSYAYSIGYENKTYFTNGVPAALQKDSWASDTTFRIYDKQWTLHVAPTLQLIEGQKSSLPMTVLIAGLLIAALSALTVRYILISRVKTARLERSTKALADSEQRYDLAVRGMSVGLWDWDVQTNALYWSQKFRDIVGVTDADFVPHYDEFAGRLHPHDKEATLAALFDHTQQLGPYNVEYRLRRNDGSYLWIHAQGQAKWDADGKAVRMAGSVDDITQKKQQQQALRTSAEQMRLLVENTPAAVAMFDHELKYVLTSRRWIEDYKLQGRQIIGKSHYEVFPEILNIPRWLDIHRRALTGEVFGIQEDSWIRADGNQEWIEWAIHPWLDDDRKVRGVVMFTEVISQRKLAQEALRASEETFRTAMLHAPIGQALVRPDGRFLQVNPALCKLLGYSEVELLANDFQSITHSEDLQRDWGLLQQVLAGELTTYQMEKRYYNKSGHIIWAHLSVSLVRRVNGQPDYLIAQIQDITERKEVDRMKNEFISVVSHELRTPLTSIRGSLGLVLGVSAKELSDKVKGLIGIAYNNCERLVLLINDILDIEKISSGHMRFDMRDESLASLTVQAVEANEAYARKFSARIALRPIDERLIVTVDVARYIQVLSNLLSNAAKFSPPEGEIKVWADAGPTHVRISIQDHGAGIPEEFRGRIFGKFAQADSSATRQKGGTGLGLHITQQLVEHMHGRIGFDTQTGVGTTFWVEFPTVTGVAAVPEKSSVEPLPIAEESELSRPLVLHIEDDDDLSKMLAMALQGEAEVIPAGTLREAERLLLRHRFAVIILDISMPDGSGLDLLPRLSSLAESTPVVILSVNPPTEVSEQVAAVIEKSRTPEKEIVDIVTSLLRHRKVAS